MKIQKVEIKNFRSIKSAEFNLFPYMVFVGKNNSGKSNLMIALEVFFTGSVNADDFFKEETNFAEILSIIVHFYQLNDKEKELYKDKLLNEGEETEHLVIRFIAELSDDRQSVASTKYEYLYETINLDSEGYKQKFGGLFEQDIYKSKKKIEEHENIPADFKQRINDFLKDKGQNKITKGEYDSLLKKYIKEILARYPNMLKSEFKEIKIPKKTADEILGKFFFIPAVQDVEKETKYTARENKNLNNLMNYVLDQMQDLDKKQEKEYEIKNILKEIYQIGVKDSGISKLQALLNEQLQVFDNSKIDFDAELPNISKMIRDSLKIYINDGISTEVQYKGHGLQRYFMVILFKVWSEKLKEIKTSESESEEKSSSKGRSTSTYFAIEEPELFLHPQYQRMMRIYLQHIAEDEGHQVILNTHSPNFIEFNNILQVAKVYKRNLAEGTKVIQPLKFNEDGTIMKKDLVCTWGRPEDRERYGNINRVNMNYYLNPERNELFFADRVVLVEGQTEKMLFQAWANHFFSNDIALINQITYIDCVGKYNFQHFIKILKEFEIPFVAIVDSDTDKSLSTQQINIHIKRDTISASGIYFELNPDFEGEFEIKEVEEDEATEEKKHKPYYAFTQFFELDGTPHKKEIEALKSNNKLKAIFRGIYGKDMA